jgi:Acetyltransferase (GNAT) domain
MIDASYVPIMMQKGWVLERYYGWTVVHEGPQLKLLQRSRGPLRSALVLARGASAESVSDLVARHRLTDWRSAVVCNDFSSRSDDRSRVVGPARFRRVTGGRWLGVGTFVFDLSDGLEALWSRVAARERTKCRKIERLGITVDFDGHPSAAAVSTFLDLYRRMARARGLAVPDHDALDHMFADGRLLMARSLDRAGRCLAASVTYLSEGQGYFLHGARADDIPDGVGHHLQWATIQALKGAGLRWYDLGLVPSRDPSDGIYRFKASLGGEFVDSGREFSFVPLGWHAGYRAVRALRTRIGRAR